MHRPADESTSRSHPVGADEAEARQSRPQSGRQDGVLSELDPVDFLLGLPPLPQQPLDVIRARATKPWRSGSARDEAFAVSSKGLSPPSGVSSVRTESVDRRSPAEEVASWLRSTALTHRIAQLREELAEAEMAREAEARR